MSNEPKSPAGATPGSAAGEPDPSELTEEELKAVAGAGIRYNFARSTSGSEILTAATSTVLRKGD